MTVAALTAPNQAKNILPVTDSQAIAFAEACYTHLLAGDPVAESVHATRLAARHDDPTWLAYSVYAHPHARVRA